MPNTKKNQDSNADRKGTTRSGSKTGNERSSQDKGRNETRTGENREGAGSR
jgi:hypothetical protein